MADDTIHGDEGNDSEILETVDEDVVVEADPSLTSGAQAPEDEVACAMDEAAEHPYASDPAAQEHAALEGEAAAKAKTEAKTEPTPSEEEPKALGLARARKVYGWLGLIGGAIAVAVGIVVLCWPTPDPSVRFGGDFYTMVYQATAAIALMIRLGLFGLLEAVGLSCVARFGRRLMRQDAGDWNVR